MSTALYRRYRPENFADVIGQEHVTEPLMSALRTDRVTHAYLFSGPRGCGKTTSARIFARCLNCAEGPTDTPCGTCPSCVELARGGAGSLDVVEMDAASHGGVNDARELRERAVFAPARDRYKVFIIDEAHMVSKEGFNALLKLVEEPPPHVKFVFATTEPDKVIGTIRSRTHHYPFRLVPPEQLQTYLERLCQAEGIEVASGVLPLVVRAGGGSVRDSLSVLDQLIAGAQDARLDYQRAIALLGYTDAALLDDVVDAIAARDGASVFRVVDRVIESGHDPRRFVEDLLERLRDVVVLALAGDHAAAALRGVPSDQLARMRTQAEHLGGVRASRAADLVNDALAEMGGATSPRLHLELLCARLLLPAAAESAREAPAAGGGPAPGGATAPARPVEARGPQQRPAAAQPPVPPVPQDPPATGLERPAAAPAAPHQPTPEREPAPAERHPAPATPVDEPGVSAIAEDRPAEASAPATPRASAPPRQQPEPSSATAPTPAAPSSASPSHAPAAPTHQSAGAVDVEMIRRRWPEVVSTLGRFKRSTWALVSQHAQVGGVTGGVLRLSFSSAGLATTFRTGPHAEPVERALVETLGVQLRVEGVVDEGGGSGPGSPGGPGGTPGTGGARPPGGQDPVDGGSGAGRSGDSGWPAPAAHGSPGGGAVAAARSSWDNEPAAASPTAVAVAERPERPVAAPEPDERRPEAAPQDERAAPPRSRSASAPADAPTEARPSAHSAGRAPSAVSADEPAAPHVAPADDTPSMDDPDAEGSGLVGVPLVVKVLGGTVIEDGPVAAPEVGAP